MDISGISSSCSTNRVVLHKITKRSPANDSEQTYRPAGVHIAVLIFLIAAAYLGSHFLAGFVHPAVSMYLIQPALWIVPIAYAYRISPTGWRRLGDSFDLIAISVIIGIVQISGSILAGILFGFGDSPYAHSPIALIENFWFVGTILIAREFARSYVLHFLENRGELIAVSVTWALFWLTSIPFAGYDRLADTGSGFAFLGQLVLPAAASSLLATYLVRRAGPFASIAYLGVLALFEWYAPILPALPWAITAFVGVLVPVFGLTVIEREDEPRQPATENGMGWSWIAAAVLLLAIIWFNTGVFGVRPALVHGVSMEPTMHTGDLAVSRPVEPENLHVGDIIRFQQGSRVVLHRIIEIQTGDDGSLTFITLGDNNPAPDAPVASADVQGELILHIPDIGWPGIYFKRAVTYLIG